MASIAVLTDEYEPYQRTLVDSACAVLNEAGYGVICLAGRELNPPTVFQRDYAVCNAIYDLVNLADLAGAIFLSGTLGHGVTHQHLCDFLGRFSLPMVSVGVDVSRIPSVLVDDIPAMNRLMQQLVADPARQHFAFVQGHARDRYSLIRENIFRDVLSRHGHRLNEQCVVEGKFEADEAYDAVKRLLIAHPEVDTIVAANDVMALSAARAVTASGRRIPADVAVTGFDDTSEATRSVPALTTIRQPTAEMARLGANRMLDQLRREGATQKRSDHDLRVPDRVVSEVIVRGSTRSNAVDTDASTMIAGDSLCDLMAKSMVGLTPPDESILAELSRALGHTLQEGSTRLESCIRKRLGKTMQAEHVHWWANVCHQMFVHGEQELSRLGQLDRLPLIEGPIASLRERIWALNMEQQFEASRHKRQLTDVQLQMGACSEFAAIVSTLARWTDNVKPQRCFLVRYSTPAKRPPDTSVLVQNFRHGVMEQVDDMSFDTAGVLPPELQSELRDGMLVLNPVYAGSEQYGYLLVDPEGIDLSGLDDLAHSIGIAMRNQFLISSLEIQTQNLQVSNSELSQLANYDTLTGLSNRHHFQQQLQEICATAETDGERFMLMFLDLDGFKPVNDSLGHEAGDQVLRMVGQRLRHAVRQARNPQDVISRLGGDEFTLILRSCRDQASVDVIANAIQKAISTPFALKDAEVNISVSIGAAIFPDHAMSASKLLRRADEAMYQAKALGRGTFVCASDGNGVDNAAPADDKLTSPIRIAGSRR